MYELVVKWLLLSCVVYAWIGEAVELKCTHPLCAENPNVNDDAIVHSFVVQGHNINMDYGDENPFYLNCDEWNALESPALPRFSSPLNVAQVHLSTCPPPGQSFAEALAALNVTINQDGESYLELKEILSQPQLSPKHFTGLENLTNLFISSTSHTKPSPKVGFLDGLKKLRALGLAGVPLQMSELDNLPELRSFTSVMTTVKPLQEMLLTIPSQLINLTLRYNEIEVTDVIRGSKPVVPSSLENLWLVKWKEQLIMPLERCDSLRLLDLKNPSVDELPEGWVEACPHLETLSIYDAEKLTSLPPDFLEGATALKHFTLSNGALQSLPSGIFESTPNLLTLDLSSNNLGMLSSTIFAGPKLQFLTLETNQLVNEALGSLSSLTSLTDLNIGQNPPLKDLCDPNDYSPLKTLTNLKHLSARELNITRICRDWRESMPFLEDLDLISTQISKLEMEDLQFTRAATVKSVLVSLQHTPITVVRFTEDGFNKEAGNETIDIPVQLKFLALELFVPAKRCIGPVSYILL